MRSSGLTVCGRYTLSTVDGPDLAQRFGLLDAPAEETLGRFNVCPTETVAAVLKPGEVAAVRWGMRPFTKSKWTPINVRSENASRRWMEGGRVLILADGWYEWLKQEAKGGARIPFRYTVDGGVPFAFAGLYDGEGVAIMTTTPNEIAAPVHDRMPVILQSPDEEAAWLSRDVGVDAAKELLRPIPSDRVSVAPANPAVNKAGVEGPELIVAP
jgi:putative SOS response-associated peptidase YedK